MPGLYHDNSEVRMTIEIKLDFKVINILIFNHLTDEFLWRSSLINYFKALDNNIF